MMRIFKTFSAVALIVVSTHQVAFADVSVQEVTSKGGISAWLVEEHSIPFTALEIRFRGGAALDRTGKRGEVNMMSAMLEEGTGDLDAQGFAKARDALAADFSFSARTDTLSISARFLSENRDESLELLRAALMEPNFDATSLERVRGQVMSVIQSNETDPSEIASGALFEQAFGDHIYGSSNDGTRSSIAALTAKDLEEARVRTMVKDRLYVAAVGDITADELADILDDLFADLPAEGPELPPYVEPDLAGGVTVVPFETPQSVVMFGHKGIQRDDEDFIPAYIANEILGGGQETRLMEEVREKRGLTYGIGTYLAPFDHSELVLGQFSSGNAVVGEAVKVVQNEWEKLAEGGISEQELSEAKTYLTGAYPLRFDGNGPIASILVGMQMVGLAPDYITRRNDLIEAVSLEKINDVVRALYTPDTLTFVVVGTPDGLSSE
jgi:zinc protease